MVAIKQLIENIKGEKLACEINLPKQSDNNKPIICILHAFTGQKKNRTINYLAKKLSQRGYKTLQFDFSGHGESEGKLEEATITKQLSDIKSVLGQAKNINSKNIILLGNSSSVVTALAFTRKHYNIKGIILLCGRASYGKQFIATNNCHLDNRIFRRDDINVDYISNKLIYNPSESIKRIRLPTLIIHGDHDEVVPVRNAKILYDISPAKVKVMKIIRGADHRFSKITWKKAILIEIYRFISRLHIQPKSDESEPCYRAL